MVRALKQSEKLIWMERDQKSGIGCIMEIIWKNGLIVTVKIKVNVKNK